MVLTRRVSGGTSLSPDGRLLSVSNLVTGFDFHNLGVKELSIAAKSMLPDVGEPYITPVLFLNDGQFLLTGSTIGEARVWATQSDAVKILKLGSEC